MVYLASTSWVIIMIPACFIHPNIWGTMEFTQPDVLGSPSARILTCLIQYESAHICRGTRLKAFYDLPPTPNKKTGLPAVSLTKVELHRLLAQIYAIPHYDPISTGTISTV